MPSCYLDFSHPIVRRIRFPALSDLEKLIAHFKRTFDFRFHELEWDVTDLWVLPRQRVLSTKTPVAIYTASCKIDGFVDLQARMVLDSRHRNLVFYHLAAHKQHAAPAIFAVLDGCSGRPRWFIEKRLWASMGSYCE